jgi:ESS family glutamate:Na+ symporter
MNSVVIIDEFLAFTIGIVVFFLGMKLNARVPFLREYNIPEPVTGGILASLVVLGLHAGMGVEFTYEIGIRNTLLVYFFTTIGINARISDLKAGGRPLLILMVLMLGYIVVQDAVGFLAAGLMGQPGALGVLTGSTSLIGGHGTAIAWAPVYAEEHGIKGALEIGTAAATLGLVLASLLGGPVAKLLLSRGNIRTPRDETLLVGIPHKKEVYEKITHLNLMQVFLVMHVAIILGFILNQGFEAIGLRLPLFVSCLLVAIVLSNSVPVLFPKLNWPARTKALAVVSDFSLSLFISMSLMGMQLWTIADLAGPLLGLLAVQAVAVTIFVFFVVYPLMGKGYLATVVSAGFVGISLGATPTAIANMTAVTKTHGPAPSAFIILPLVGAFFVDITNAFVIQFFLGLGS